MPHVATGGEATTTGAGTAPNATGEEASGASAKESGGNARSESTNTTTPEGQYRKEPDQPGKQRNQFGRRKEIPATARVPEEGSATSFGSQEYVLNTKSMKFHRPTCSFRSTT